MTTQANETNFLSATTAKRQGRAEYYKLLEKAKGGKIIRIRRGVYASQEQLADTMIDIDTVVPGGILCLYSAWNIHDMTTSLPQAYHVAIKRGRKVVLPTFPSIELHHRSAQWLELGAEERLVNGYRVKVYNPERCVCDAVKFRHKIGMDICAEVFDAYLSRTDRNLSLLCDYARQLRILGVIQKYLEVKL